MQNDCANTMKKSLKISDFRLVKNQEKLRATNSAILFFI